LFLNFKENSLTQLTAQFLFEKMSEKYFWDKLKKLQPAYNQLNRHICNDIIFILHLAGIIFHKGQFDNMEFGCSLIGILNINNLNTSKTFFTYD